MIQVPTKRLYKLTSAAEYLDMDPQTVRKEIREGNLRAKKKGQYYYTTIEWLDGYIDSLPECTPGSSVGEETIHGD